MDEVDKIIVHSLKQIGCTIERDDEGEVFGLRHFTPDLLVRAVSKCLQEIKKDSVLPKSLPENMAQRFAVATSLAEACSACGYRGDIGYQTFLYPNEVDIRRLFMFLIEQLPKDQICGTYDSLQEDKDDFVVLLRDVRKKIKQILKSPWVPQYCHGIGNRKILGSSALNVGFVPQLNLSIPDIENHAERKEQLVTYQIPNIFQQTSVVEFDLISSVLHRNAIDVYASFAHSRDVPLTLTNFIKPIILSPVRHSIKDIENQNHIKDKMEFQNKSVEKATEDVESLKLQNELVIKERQSANAKLNLLRQERSEIESQIEDLKKKAKICERTSVIMENPQENIVKLENLIEKTRERRLVLETQWQLHRNPALKQIDELQKLRQSKNLQSIHELRGFIQQLQTALIEKNRNHSALEDELKKASIGGVSRKEYTRRIYEFIGNIRKQRNDIYKILDDTKDLQKQLNAISAQLQRQFNYTDDLLFQSAKHDLHAKQAYKLLALLRASCEEISKLVSQAGQMTKESRDFEVQIDRESMRNVAASLEKITLDIKKFEMIAKTMKTDINQVEK